METPQVITPSGAQSAKAVIVFTGESATFAGHGVELSIVAGDPKSVKVTKDGKATFNAPGRYTLDAKSGFAGMRVTVVCVDPDCLRFIHVDERTTAGGNIPAAKLEVLRSVALHGDGFDGTVASLRRHRLQDHGAVNPRNTPNVVRNRPGGQSFTAG